MKLSIYVLFIIFGIILFLIWNNKDRFTIGGNGNGFERKVLFLKKFKSGVWGRVINREIGYRDYSPNPDMVDRPRHLPQFPRDYGTDWYNPSNDNFGNPAEVATYALIDKELNLSRSDAAVDGGVTPSTLWRRRAHFKVFKLIHESKPDLSKHQRILVPIILTSIGLFYKNWRYYGGCQTG